MYFKNNLKTIDDWSQCLAILITNHTGTWDKEIFVNYITGTLQGEVLQ